jgi:hypothetical protein
MRRAAYLICTWFWALQAGFQKTMDEMTDEAFEKNKTALIALKMQKDKTLYDESDRHWEAIQSEKYDFEARETIAEEVRTTPTHIPHAAASGNPSFTSMICIICQVKSVQLGELRTWYAQHLAPGGAKRRQMLVAVYGKQHALPEASEVRTLLYVPNEREREREWTRWAHTRPHKLLATWFTSPITLGQQSACNQGRSTMVPYLYGWRRGCAGDGKLGRADRRLAELAALPSARCAERA